MYETLKEQGWPVEPVEQLQQGGFEQVVVAVRSSEQAAEIREMLALMGIEKELIFWL